MKYPCFSCLIFIASIFSSFANTHLVPQAYSQISDALNACQDFDTVLVDVGVYNENITWPGVQGVKLISVGGPQNTIIDGTNSGQVINISGNSSADSVILIKGFTVQHGSFTAGYYSNGLLSGAGISLRDANIILEDVIITSNHLTGTQNSYGCGLFADSSQLIIKNSTISKNNISSGDRSFGAGIFTQYSNLTIDHCNINFNESTSASWNYGAGVCCLYGSLSMNSCRVMYNELHAGSLWNFGGGIYHDNIGGNVDIINCLIANNHVDTTTNWHDAAGIYIDGKADYSSSVINIVHCTIANNYSGTHSFGNSLTLDLSPSNAYTYTINITNSILFSQCFREVDTSFYGPVNFLVSNNDIHQTAYGGLNSITSNPEFVSATDFHLLPNSPCVNSGINILNVDLDDTIRPLPTGHLPDMGCYEINEATTDISLLADKFNLIKSFTNDLMTLNFIPGRFSIYDLTGKLITEKLISKEYDTSIDISFLHGGIYIYSFLGAEEKRYSGRIKIDK